MASYTIPEQVLGIPLFVPDGHDYFSIDTAGMPNGDDCLIVHGDVSTDYKAFMPAPLTIPDLFRDRTAAPWSMVFWFKGTAVPVFGPTTSPFSSIISCTNATFTNNTTSGNANTSSFGRQTGGAGITWGVGSAHGPGNVFNGIGFGRPSSSTNNITTGISQAVADGNWHMITIRVSASNSISIYVDDETTARSSSGTSVTTGVQTQQFLCIGSYSSLGDCQGRAGEYRLGKLSFHDHVLNQTERSVLWEAMTS